MNKEAKLKFLMTVCAWLVSVLLAFSAVKQDVAVIKATQQAQYDQIQQQLRDIKNQLDRLEYDTSGRSR